MLLCWFLLGDSVSFCFLGQSHFLLRKPLDFLQSNGKQMDILVHSILWGLGGRKSSVNTGCRVEEGLVRKGHYIRVTFISIVTFNLYSKFILRILRKERTLACIVVLQGSFHSVFKSGVQSPMAVVVVTGVWS